MENRETVPAIDLTDNSDLAKRNLRYFWLWRRLGDALILLVVYLSLTPSDFDIPVGFDGDDKLGHALAYATLTTWFGWLTTARPRQLRCAGLFVLLGLTLETLQRFTGYRHWDLWDIAANTAGVLIGLGLVCSRLPNGLVFVERCQSQVRRWLGQAD